MDWTYVKSTISSVILFARNCRLCSYSYAPNSVLYIPRRCSILLLIGLYQMNRTLVFAVLLLIVFTKLKSQLVSIISRGNETSHSRRSVSSIRDFREACKGSKTCCVKKGKRLGFASRGGMKVIKGYPMLDISTWLQADRLEIRKRE